MTYFIFVLLSVVGQLIFWFEVKLIGDRDNLIKYWLLLVVSNGSDSVFQVGLDSLSLVFLKITEQASAVKAVKVETDFGNFENEEQIHFERCQIINQE